MDIIRTAKLLIPLGLFRPIALDDLLEPPPSYTDDPQTGNGEVRLGGIEFPVLNGSVNELQLARFQAKVTFGDYDLDSDPLLSARVYSNFSGGMGNEVEKAGVDDDTFWDATLETRYPDGATLLPRSTGYTGTPSDSPAMPIGDFPAADPRFYAAFDDSLQIWDADAATFTEVTALTNRPVERGVEFEGAFYIPLGPFGFDVFVDDVTPIANDTTFEPLQFMMWDRKLAALDRDGVLWIKPPGGGAWAIAATVPEDATIPSGNTPRRMVVFMDQRAVPTIHIITDSVVFAWDPDNEVLYETRLDFPKHPNQGLAAANWRGDTMFVSVGTGIHGYNGSTITAMGPDGRYGLPARLRGAIVDLVSEYNGLLAYVRGTGVETTTEAEDTFVINPPMFRDRDAYGTSVTTQGQVYSSILRWSNSQWHKVWESDVATGAPTKMYVSQADGDYRLWWGYETKMYVQDLPVDFQNPKQGLKSGSMAFAPSGFLITGWFDAGMAAFTKLATHIEVNLDDVLAGYDEPGGSVTVQYQHNESSAWKTLGTADSVGKTTLPFQNVIHRTGIDFSNGLAFRRIRFRFQYAQKAGSTTLSPLMTSAVFKFIKIPESQLSWSFTVPLDQPNGYKGKGNDELARMLNAALYSSVFIDFEYRDRVYRVRVAQTVGDRMTGYDERGNYQVNLVEVTLGSTRDDSTVIKYTDKAV